MCIVTFSLEVGLEFDSVVWNCLWLNITVCFEFPISERLIGVL